MLRGLSVLMCTNYFSCTYTLTKKKLESLASDFQFSNIYSKYNQNSCASFIHTCKYIYAMNTGKLEVVKQEVARVNVDIVGISELRWTGMGEFNSDDHYI